MNISCREVSIDMVIQIGIFPPNHALPLFYLKAGISFLCRLLLIVLELVAVKFYDIVKISITADEVESRKC